MRARRLAPRSVSLAATLATLAACAPPPGVAGPPADTDAGTPARDGSAPQTDGGTPTGEPTYYGQVDDLLAAHCWGCHSADAGGIAPFALDTYESAAAASGAVAAATAARTMPPFFAVDDGSCQSFEDDGRWLSDAEIATLATWAARGAPMGDPTSPPPERMQVPHIDAPDVTITMPTPYTQQLSPNEIRCFVADPHVTADTFITAYEVLPGTPSVVHHVIVYEPETDADATTATGMQGTDGQPGYRCDGGPVVPGHPVALWAPGSHRTAYPAGTGLALPAGRRLIIQVHYNDSTSGGPRADQTSIAFETTATVAQPAQMMLLNQTDITLPPRATSTTTAQKTLRVPAAGRIWGVFPHMHVTGRHLGLTMTSTAGTSCLLDVQRWDFNWQQAYFFTSPIDARAGDRIAIECEYDTSSRDATTTFGEGTEDEMCLSFFYVTAR
ncbi:MAG: hypothetical protein U0234_21600 [Sandaracinus sp.]